MQALPDAIARHLGDRFRPASRVRALERVGTDWRVSLEDGTALEARDVVLTTPASVTADLLRPSAPTAADAVSTLTYNQLAMVHLEAETDLRGTGFKVSFQDRHLALGGVTFNDSLFGRENLYTAYVGGGWHAELMGRENQELAELAVRDFRKTTGFEGRPISVERAEIPAWDKSWQALWEFSLPEGLHVAANWNERPGIPGRLVQARRLATALTAGATSSATASAVG